MTTSCDKYFNVAKHHTVIWQDCDGMHLNRGKEKVSHHVFPFSIVLFVYKNLFCKHGEIAPSPTEIFIMNEPGGTIDPAVEALAEDLAQGARNSDPIRSLRNLFWNQSSL